MTTNRALKEVEKLFLKGEIYGYSVEGDQIIVMAPKSTAKKLESLEGVKVICISEMPKAFG